MPAKRTRPTREERFWAKVEKTDTCWTWIASLDGRGYGQFDHQRSHRVSYELLVGPIPEGLVLDHLCRNKRCVNPDHLEPVTHLENLRRGTPGSAHNTRKTHCPKGHEYTPENTRVKDGKRNCKACAADHQRRYRKRRRREGT